MKYQRRREIGAFFAAALLSSISTGAIGGTMTAKDAVEPRPVSAPLSFLDGKLVFDLQERLRWEIRENNFDFDDSTHAPTDDNWFLQRFRIGLLIKAAPWLRLYAQGQDAREINSDRADNPGVLGAEGDDAFDLRQGWIEIGNTKEFPLTLKFGRQILSYGEERLIGAFDWNNIGRTFDAVKLRWEEKKWWLDAFVSSVVNAERGSYNQSDLFNGNESDRAQIFSGLYFATGALPFQSVELYALHLHENTSARYQPNPLGDTNFLTLGARVKSVPGFFARGEEASHDGKGTASDKPEAVRKPTGFDYDAELAFQTGEVRGMDLTALAAHAGIGYTFDARWSPRLGIEYAYGSGDDDPADAEIETFQNLFPTNHKFYGQMDLFAWQNVHNLAATFRLRPVRSVSIKVGYDAFWLASTDDFWYRANGVATVRPLTPAAREASNYAGSEVDLIVTWAVNAALTVEAGYSHFFAGDYLAETGASDDADFAYVQATLTF